MNVWLLQTGEPLHIDAGNPRPMRAMNLANALATAGHNVVLWSSAFHHQEKRHRSRCARRIIVSAQLEIRLIPSPGYVRNIGHGRLWDHVILGLNVWHHLKQETQLPDVAFIGYPPIEAAAIMTHWLSVRGVPIMLDIKDQWPNIFVDSLPVTMRPLGRIILAPYFYLAKSAMRDATGLSAMAGGFLSWALDFAGRQRNEFDRVVPLTTPIAQISAGELDFARQWWDNKGIVADHRPRICFVGSHSQAFDIEPIYQAAKHFSSHANQCEFVICGDGEYSAAWRSLMSGLPNVHFSGWIDRPQIEALAERTYAAITPYRNSESFTKSLPNKVIDALSLGLPILSPLQGEVAILIDNNRVGLRYGTDSGKSLIQCIELLIADPDLRQQISINALNLYCQNFCSDIVYGGLVNHLEALSLRWCRMPNMDNDKLAELLRYEASARSRLSTCGAIPAPMEFGSAAMAQYLRAPYIFYEKFVNKLIRPQDHVLELGAGSGLHTWSLVQTGAVITATDISPNSLKLLIQCIEISGGHVTTQVADMESLPFADASFDVVACAGSLSYGEPARVNAEIRRVLRPGGVLICVDTLNHNPIYRINRWLHYLRGKRTKSTLKRMPDIERINALGDRFSKVNVYYFGALSFAMPVLARLLGEKAAQAVSNWFDQSIGLKRLAFKFVLVAQGFT